MYLTFDIGTTALKTALIDGNGRMLAVHTAEYTARVPHPGWSEMSPQDYWDAAAQGVRAVFTRTGADPAGLAAIGFSSQGQTFIPVDASGTPLYDAIVWVDQRARQIAEEWESTWLPRDEYRRITGQAVLGCGLTPFKLAWLSRNRPEVVADARWFLFLPDYLALRMTGEAATDRVIANFSGMFDFRADTWDPRILQAAGIRPAQLPRVLAPGSVVGCLTGDAARELGLRSGVPVCVGANDQVCGAVGAGNVRPGTVTETTGAALALIATTAEPLDDERLSVGPHAVPDACYALSFAMTSAIVLTWFRDMCAGEEDYDELLGGIEAIAPGSDGLTVLPHFAGTGAPTYNPHARGAFIGLSLGHTRAHLVRAITEACACLLQECLEPIEEHVGKLRSVRSLGGAARSNVWLQIKSELLGIPVERPACADAASLGAAMLAAAGTGRFGSVAEASDAWYRPAQVFEPDPSRYDAYRDVYGRYKDLCSKLYSS